MALQLDFAIADLSNCGQLLFGLLHESSFALFVDTTVGIEPRIAFL